MKNKLNIRNLRWYFLSLLFLSTGYVFSQEATVTGKVFDENKETMIGLNIVEKGTTNGTITNAEGTYSLKVSSENAVLVYSFIGYKTQEVLVGKQREINIDMKLESIGIDELVVVGYTTEKKSDLTGSVSIVDMEEIKELPSGNIMKNMQGRVAGVDVYTDGSPGSGAVVRIRGTGTLNNNDPLYVIDGVPTKGGMHELNPNDIASVQVLKDASAASIYGSRSANGVIIITTKQAKEGEVMVDFDASFSVQRYNTKLNQLNTYDRGLVYWQSAVNDRLNPSSPFYLYSWNGDFNNPILGDITYPEYIDAAKTMKPADTNWYDEVSRMANLQNYNLSISKGSQQGRYMFSLGYYDHDGIVNETNFKRFNARFNSSFNLFNDIVTIGENFTMSYQKEILINASDVLFNSLVQHPIVPVHTENGGWGGPVSGMTDRQNPVRLIEDNKQNFYTYVRPFGNAFIEIKPIKNLKLKSSFGIDYSIFMARTLDKSYESGFLVEPNNRVNNQENHKGNWVWSNTAIYDFEKNQHQASILAGTEQVNYSEEWFNASRRGLAIEDMDYAYLNSGTTEQLNAGSGSKWALQSFFGKLNYSFANNYLLSFTVRRDGSSRFGANNQYATFPAVSAGWRLSEEKFMQNLIKIPFYMKLRASWGQNGNQEINDLARYNIYRTVYGKEDAIWDNPNPPEYMPNLGTAYDISGADGGQLQSGYITSQIGNDDLKWETTTQTNVGLDYSFSNTFSGSLDYYIKKTDDILYYKFLVSAVGEASGQYVNGGSVENKGMEFILNYDKNFNNAWSLNLSGNFALVKNKIIDMPEDMTIRTPITGIIPNDAKTELESSYLIGHSVNSIYGYIADGLFQNQGEVDAHAQQPGKGIGRIRFRDISGPDGTPDGIVDQNDQTFIAVADPDFTFGLNAQVAYKNWSLDLFIQGVQGIEVYNVYKTYTDFASLWPGTNWGNRTLDAWSPTNTTSDIPKLTVLDTNNEGRLSTYFIENGSYVKLRNIQLSYDFSKSQLNETFFKSAKIFVQGQNLFTIKSKDYTGTDPENPNNSFPIPVMYTIGVKLGF